MAEVFLAREALGEGMPRNDLRRWYRPMYRGVHVGRWERPTLQDRILGAHLTTGRTGVIAGVAASALHGAAWVGDAEPVEVLARNRRRQAGLIVRQDRIADDEIVRVAGLPVTSPARTAFDLGRYQQRTVALARLDALMRAAPFDPREVATLLSRYGPVRGVRQLRELLPLVDAGAASPQESRLRLLLVDNGFPTPQTQIPVHDADGTPVAYLDMGWRELGLGVEYDGDQHRTDRAQYVRDLHRHRRLAELGWEVIRVVAEDRAADVLRRVREAFLRRGGAEIDEMAGSSRTFPPKGAFGRRSA